MNKKLVIYLSVGCTFLFCTGFFFVNPVFMAETKAKYVAASFLNNLIENDLTRAFHYVHYYDTGIEGSSDITHSDAQKIWIERVKRLNETGTYVKSYSDLHVTTHDRWVNGTVKLHLLENNKESIYKVNIGFQKSGGTWKVSAIQYLDNKGEQLAWEKALSGLIQKK